MAEPVSLADIKVHLRLDAGETGEDDNLSAMLIAARRTIEARIGCTIADAALAPDDLIVIGHAVRLIVGSWYANREAVVTGTIATELPAGVKWLLEPLRRIPTP